ncbi:Rrf2 family transcriptional regulator [Pyxidicoccus fallax]|uniref:Rrf2 family transcriptional regulator n=1 Tax=Pyxidicoccus fallax TaxID=394095 RepID=A0A848LEK0_9BACT|nr:Rrf2 family transcriptional regulator [Pyxidicoccus fallax]NMO15273.1 Rrf2 family transcriptional regulator [Pyxidicoccus fallax]NPC77614.1 Rrf2 family transcriptional regulator [Pyxidicoccus fallax]
MKLSQKTKYALRALQVLAREREPVRIATLAEREDIPRKFLEHILLELNNHGILSSRRGRGGGYQLRKQPEDVCLGDVVRLFDGPLAPTSCSSERAFRACDDCKDPDGCALRGVMREVRDATARILDNLSLADLNQRADAVARLTPGGR